MRNIFILNIIVELLNSNSDRQHLNPLKCSEGTTTCYKFFFICTTCAERRIWYSCNDGGRGGRASRKSYWVRPTSQCTGEAIEMVEGNWIDLHWICTENKKCRKTNETRLSSFNLADWAWNFLSLFAVVCALCSGELRKKPQTQSGMTFSHSPTLFGMSESSLSLMSCLFAHTKLTLTLPNVNKHSTIVLLTLIRNRFQICWKILVCNSFSLVRLLMLMIVHTPHKSHFRRVMASSSSSSEQ